jgi:prepilin-type N-terminal cleavage/methylation domain-containing protein
MLSAHRRARGLRAIRTGFTLVELLIVIVILAVVLTSVMTIFVQQQRFYSDSSAIIETRSSTRDAAYVLQSDFRSLSPKSGDIYAMGPSFMEFRSQLGSTVVCTIDPTRTIITVPPLNVATGAALTSWLTPPANGDTVLIFAPGSTAAAVSDTFYVYALTALPTGNASCPNSTSLTTTAGEATQGFTFKVTPALSAGTIVGSPIRIMRRARYELYQAASGNWYLGYFDCVPLRVPVCNALQPIAGPYVAPNLVGTGGIAFTYRDSLGVVTADPKLVRRVDLAARAQTSVSVHTSGYTRGPLTDSTFVSIAPRN